MSKEGTNQVLHEFQGDIAVVTLDHFPVNTLTNAVQIGLEDAGNAISEKLAKDPSSVTAVIVRGAGLRAFCAGADIPDLNRKHPRYPTKPFMEHFEHLSIPVVALVQGFALGGGTELALGCHYRVCTPSAAFGLPEVNIGLLPGGQGTQRLPRLVGVSSALEIMLTGRHIPAKEAEKFGLVDLIMSKETNTSSEAQLKEAINFARSKKGADMKTRRLRDLPAPKMDDAGKQEIEKFKKIIAKTRRNEVAPEQIIGCVIAATEAETFEDGISEEMRRFLICKNSPQALGLQHIFFSERGVGKLKGNNEKPAKIKKVGVLGAGTMGGGIAMCFAQVGCDVILVDREEKFVKNGLEVIKSNYATSVKRGSIPQKLAEAALAKITTSTDYNSFKDVDLVIEAVFEDIELKKEIFAKLDKICKKDCILATNTSYLNIDAMAEMTSRPEKVVGMHFFSPANVMKLLENIRGKATDEKTCKSVMEVGMKIGKWPVLVRNRNGFVGNRMLAYYQGQANQMVLHGVDFKKIDALAYKFGMPMGPFRMIDLVGLDIGYQARKKKGLVDVKKNFADALIEAGRLGMKNGKGWYEYDAKTRAQKPSPEADHIVAQVVANNALEKWNLTDKEIEQRLFFPVINDGFRVLEEKVCENVDDIDVVFVHGYNWPRPTGGPMFYADLIGVKNVLKVLEDTYAKTKDPMFKPAQLLLDVAASGKPLQVYWPKNKDNYKFDDSRAHL